MSARFRAVESKTSGWMTLLLVVVSLVMLLPLYVSVKTLWGATNLNYGVYAHELQITYAWQTERLPLGSIQSVELLRPTNLRRINGTNTPGLYTGRWTSKETGPLELYASRLDSLLVIKTTDGTWGLTPADPAALQEALKTGSYLDYPPAAPDGSPLVVTIPLFVLILLLVPGTWWLMRLLHRFPRHLTYELGPSELVIKTGWRPVRLPYSEIDSVEESTLKGWPMRVYGSELKGLHWGLFIWSAVPGKRIYLYATQLKPIVLIRAGKKSFGLSPADGAGFVAALQERIGKG